MSIRQGRTIVAGNIISEGIQIVGQIIQVICSESYIPNGCLPCDGSEYTAANFPYLWNNFLVSSPALLKTCSYAEYTNDITTYGQCAKFGVDISGNTFKVPTIKDGSYITQAKSNSELGKSYNESLPNITGGITGTHVRNNVGTAGCGYGAVEVGPNRSGYTGSYPESTGSASWDFNASRSSSTYQNGAKVQGDNVRVRYFIVVANGQINQSQMDWSTWASNLTTLQNGLSSLQNATSFTASGKKALTVLAMPSIYYIDVPLATGTYTAPANGYFQISVNLNDRGSYGYVGIEANGLYSKGWGNEYTRDDFRFFIPVKKGNVVSYGVTGSSTWNYARFIYAEGEL